MVKAVADRQPVVLFKKYNMDADKPDPVVNIPPARFIGGTIIQGITGSIHIS